MTDKFCFLDVETTGLDADKNGIHQISAIIDIDRKTEMAFDFRVAPFSTDVIEKDALDVAGVTEERIKSYESPSVVFKKLLAIFDKYINRYDKNDKFVFVGYNSPFDDEMMRSFFKKNDHKYYGSYFRWPDCCVARMYMERCLATNEWPESWKLKGLASKLRLAKEEDPRWHDAMFDIRVTRGLFYVLRDWKPTSPANWDEFITKNWEDEPKPTTDYIVVKTRRK